MLDNVLSIFPSTPVKPNGVKKILIMGDMGIGNMIMFTPTLKAIRRRFPSANITLVVRHTGCEEVVRGSSLVDNIEKTKANIVETFKFLKTVRNKRYDLLINTFIRQNSDLFIGMFGGIKFRVAHSKSYGWEGRFDAPYNIKVQMNKNEHEIDRHLRLAKACDMQILDDSPVFHISQEDDNYAEEFITQHGIDNGDLLVAIQVTPRNHQPWKHWRYDRLAEVCNQLKERYGAEIVLLGAPQHKKELATIVGYMNHKPIVALGKANLKQAAAIVKRCTFTISSDTSLIHISAVVGTPVIAIYGPTDLSRTSPLRYGKGHIILRKELACSPCYKLEGEDKVLACSDRRCLDMITSEDVLRCAERLIHN